MILMELDVTLGEFGFKRAVVDTSSTSDHILLSADIREPTASVYPTGNNRAVVQFSCESNAEIMAGNGHWKDWALGTVREDTSDGLVATVTALRVVSIDGAPVRLSVVGK